MKKTSNTCARCRNFTAYFSKAYCCILRTKCGHCSKKNTTVDKNETCDNWQGRSYKRVTSKDAIIKEAGQIFYKVNILKEFIENGRD